MNLKSFLSLYKSVEVERLGNLMIAAEAPEGSEKKTPSEVVFESIGTYKSFSACSSIRHPLDATSLLGGEEFSGNSNSNKEIDFEIENEFVVKVVESKGRQKFGDWFYRNSLKSKEMREGLEKKGVEGIIGTGSGVAEKGEGKTGVVAEGKTGGEGKERKEGGKRVAWAKET